MPHNAYVTQARSSLPIESALPDLRTALLDARNVVLQAPPGTGKSTHVPLALLNEPWMRGQRMIMLEPRRLAARAVATRMAHSLGEVVGKTVGYRTRLETRVSRETRIEVVTEGILTRWLQNDPALESVALVIFDEFHERSLNADLGLALCLDAQEALRDDLRLLVMSATLAVEPIAQLLGEAPIVASPGRAFEVQTHYRQRVPGRGARADDDVARLVAGTLLRVIEDETGDVLTFLPGQGEIRRTQRLLEEAHLPRDVRILPLYGDLSLEQQDVALRPSSTGTRKIVLATNIAETSLTIDGVRVVVDSGLERRARFDPATGMSRLETVRISRASADQRRGRAGRLGPGVCYRLWTETEHAALAAHSAPEIVAADLAPLALELAQWGIDAPSALRWLDPPPAASFAQARDLLGALQALNDAGRINDHGRAMARLGTHPRLAHMIVRAAELGIAHTAVLIAAVLSERDLLRSGTSRRDVDLRLRIEALAGEKALPHGLTVDAAARQRALRSAEQLSRQLPGSQPRTDIAIDAVGRLLALAYPDRIGQARSGDGRYLLASGRGAQLPEPQALGDAEFIVAVEVDAGTRDAMIRLAAPLDRATLTAEFAHRIVERERVEWNPREQAVVAVRERTLGALRLEERRIDPTGDARVVAALIEGIRALGLDALPWNKDSLQLQTRLNFIRSHDERALTPWPDLSAATLLETLDEWLAPWLSGMTRREHLARLNMLEVLQGLLSWEQLKRLDELAPTHLVVPSGSRIPIDYGADVPTVSVRLQEMFGLTQTPSIASGRVPLTIQLLSPAHRPVQVTRDLVSFWVRGYPDVKKELKGRYPKHYWPDNPLQAEPTARAKRRGT